MCNPPGHRTTTFVVDLREKSCETASWGWLTSFFPSSQSPYIAVIRPSHLPLVSAAMEAKLGCHGSEERSPPCLTRDPEGLHLQLSSATWPSHPPPRPVQGLPCLCYHRGSCPLPGGARWQLRACLSSGCLGCGLGLWFLTSFIVSAIPV